MLARTELIVKIIASAAPSMQLNTVAKVSSLESVTIRKELVAAMMRVLFLQS